MSDENKIRDAANVVKGIVEAVPIYQDTVQPAAREVGTALQTVAKTIHIVLAPLSGLVWGYDQLKEFLSTKVAEKLKHVPPENIASPKPNVAGPALESLKYTGHEETLRDLYANLLAASMDTRTASGAHPAFVEIIKQLTPDEAKIIGLFAQNRSLPLINIRAEFKVESDTERGGKDVLTNFSILGWEAGCEFPHLAPSYIDNLCRLGLAEVPAFLRYTAPGVYEPLENHPTVQTIRRKIEADERFRAGIERKGIRVTELGRQFIYNCVISHDQMDFPTREGV